MGYGDGVWVWVIRGGEVVRDRVWVVVFDHASEGFGVHACMGKGLIGHASGENGKGIRAWLEGREKRHARVHVSGRRGGRKDMYGSA